MWSVLGNTLLLAATVAGLALPTGTLLGWLLTRVAWPGRFVVGASLALLLFLPLYLQAAAWDAGFGRQGWYTYLWTQVSLPWLTGWRAAIFIHSVAALPWVTLITAVGFQQVEKKLEEAAWLDGPQLATFRRVALARAWPSIVVAGAWVLILVAGEMTVTDMYQVRTFAEELYINFALGDDLVENLSRLSAGLTLLATVLVAVAIGLAYWLPGRVVGVPRRSAPMRGERSVRVIAACGGVLVGVMTLVPIGNLVHNAGVDVQRADGRAVRSWSAGKAAAIVAGTPRRYAAEFRGTAELAAWSTIFTLSLAVPLAWWARRGRVRMMLAALAGLSGLVVPGPLFAVGLLRLRDLVALDAFDTLAERSLVLPAVVVAWRSLAVCTAVLWYGFRTVPVAQLEAAALDGLSPLRQLWHLGLAQRKSNVAAAAIIAWSLAAGDLTSTILLVPQRYSTIAIRTFQLVHAGVDDRLAGLCLVSTALFAAAAIAILALTSRGFIVAHGGLYSATDGLVDQSSSAARPR